MQAGDRIQNREHAVVVQLDLLIDRFDELDIHGQLLLEIPVGLADPREFLADLEIPLSGHLLGLEHHPQAGPGVLDSRDCSRSSRLDGHMQGTIRVDSGAPGLASRTLPYYWVRDSYIPESMSGNQN